MDFAFSAEQEELRGRVRETLKAVSTSEVVHRVFNQSAPYADEVWAEVISQGWLATAIPAQYGGAGRSYLELCVIAEEIGRVLAPIPFSSSIYLAAEAILVAGSEAQKAKWLPRLASGASIGTLAVAEGVGRSTFAKLEATVRDGKLSGTKLPVPDAACADIAVVLARGTADKGERGLSLYLSELKGPGVTIEARESFDPTRGQAAVSFDGTPVELLGDGREGAADANRVLDRAAVLMAFEQLGGAEASLTKIRDYLRERYAFGRPLGSFQALKHKLADLYVGNELARSNAYYGAYALSTEAADLPIAAAGARVSATEAYHQASKENLYLHGAKGYAWAGDCHLYFRRSRNLALGLGSARTWKERLVRELEKQNQRAA